MDKWNSTSELHYLCELSYVNSDVITEKIMLLVMTTKMMVLIMIIES